MYAAVLLDDAAAVDWYHLAVGEHLLNKADGSLVVVRLIVCGNEYGTVDYKVVGISCGQLTAVLIEDGVGQGQTQQCALWGDACDGVDMSVGVVARQGLVVEPYDAVGTESPFQFALYLM